MNLKTTAISAGLAAVLGTAAAIAQPAPQGQDGYQGSPAYRQGDQDSYRSARRHHHGVKMLITEEVRAGRMSQKEASLLERKIHELHAAKRAERQARDTGEQGVPPPGQIPPSR